MKEKKPVIPKERVRDYIPPDVPMSKWNIKMSEGELVLDMLDKDGLPLSRPVVPKKKKK